MGKISQDIIERIKGIVGENHVLQDNLSLEKYSKDETIGLQSYPDLVVRVRSPEEISQILILANDHSIPVTPRGLGTSLSGGSVPVKGGIVLSMERMDTMLEIDDRNLMAVVEPGMVTSEIHRLVELEGCFYPPDPASKDSCSIGGNVAEGAGGPRAVRYGTTKDYISGLEAVLPTGEIIKTGGKVVKDVTGYNLTQLLVGSEGTLAIVTKIILRLIPKPKMKVDLLAPFDALEPAAEAVSAIIKEKIVPTAIEFMDNPAIRLAERYLNKKVSFNNAKAHILVQLDGNKEEEFERSMEVVGDIFERYGAWDLLVAREPEAQNRLWEARRCIFEAANRIGIPYETMDVVAPRSSVASLVKAAEEIALSFDIDPVCVGHAGDGNVHVLYFKRDDMDMEQWRIKLPEASKRLYRKTLEMGGKITAEHGIGVTRKPYLSMDYSDRQIEILKGIKKSFDPKGILNPGKIFD
ncbi:MAG: FAD-binding protein [Syntrophorhabdaceae bacterium]|nr:FAD-binding protein [Syntrophorhabdaceae bacterium]